MSDERRETSTIRELAPCAECGEPTLRENDDGTPVVGGCEYFMVNDSLWSQVARQGERWLCIRCIESRLGRDIGPGDFAVQLVFSPIGILSPEEAKALPRRLKRRARCIVPVHQAVSPFDTPHLASRKQQGPGGIVFTFEAGVLSQLAKGDGSEGWWENGEEEP